MNEKDENSFNKGWSDPIYSYLKSQISFGDCCAVYILLDERHQIPDIWGFRHRNGPIDRFLTDLSQYFRGEATQIQARALEEAIKDTQQNALSDYGYGTCRFVYPRDSTNE
jgi:hypothetical protein